MTAIQALQRALAVEHEIVYGYGLVGSHVRSARDRRWSLDRLAAHQLLRDRLAALVRGGGAVPVVPRPAYLPPFPLTRDSAPRLAAQLESAVAGAAWDVVAAAGAATAARSIGIATLLDAASWEQRWHDAAGDQVMLPALPGQPA